MIIAAMTSESRKRHRPADGSASALRMASAQMHASVIDDESVPWVPLAPYNAEVAVKYFRLDPARGEIIMLLRAPSGTRLPRLHHSGAVIVYTVEGRWKYVEQDWIAGPRSVAFGPAASSHTPMVVGDEGPAVALLMIVGDVIFYDDAGAVLAIENWKSALQRYLAYCEEAGVTPRNLTAPA